LTQQPSEIERAVLDAVAASRGHFVYESGYYGDLWLELDGLFVDARRARGWASALADRAVACRPELVCGPLTGGAFVAQPLAAEIGTGFVFAERFVSETGSVRYRIPGVSMRGFVQQARPAGGRCSQRWFGFALDTDRLAGYVPPCSH
jgi:orotate phosphoribosyltransferase